MNKYTQRPDGRYQSKVYLGKDASGKKQYKYIYANSQKELEAKIQSIKADINKGLKVLNATDTFGDWAQVTLELQEHHLKPLEFSTFRTRLNYFTDYLGTYKLRDITTNQIQLIINELEQQNPNTLKPSSRKTLTNYLWVCSQVFTQAIVNRIIEFNPCQYVTVNKQAPKKERRALTDLERQRVEEFEHRAQLPAMLMIYSGLRRGEATALLWSDIDLDNATITINKSYDFKTETLKKPKTAAGIRIVSIPQKLVNYLRQQPQTSKYVVHKVDGTRMTKSAWASLWDSYMLDLDIEYGADQKKKSKYTSGHQYTITKFSLHECRHTFCTILYHAGVDVLTCSKLMGHSSIQTTLTIYTHLDNVYKKKNINKLDDFLA